MNILYSFNKNGFEADYWQREIAGSSCEHYTFIPFNHGEYLNPERYVRAQLLDNLYYRRDSDLFRLYDDFEAVVLKYNAAAVIVDNYPPYHPDYLRRISAYKVLRTSDGPISAYDRDFAYLHAYDHVLYHSPAYSADLTMEEKLRYCGAHNIDFWPLALFDTAFDAKETEESLASKTRDIDVIFIGALHLGKMPLLARVKKAFGSRCRIHGLTSLKRNLYFNAKFGFPAWIRPIPFEEYVPLYQRSAVGINLHNRGKYTVGNYRLFDLPANGVMQISDGGEYLSKYFRVGEEIISYDTDDELLEKLHYYLKHPQERQAIALKGYRRVLRDHRIRDRLRAAGELIERGMDRSGWKQRQSASHRSHIAITSKRCSNC